MKNALKYVSVIGAAGKMGSGISSVLLQTMACLDAEQSGMIGSGQYNLLLIDSNEAALNDLKQYLESELQKYGEQSINLLRAYFAKNPLLVSNGEVISYFIKNAFKIVHYATSISKITKPSLVFEAIVEDVSIKSAILKMIDSRTEKSSFYFSNTSSIPIEILNDKAALEDRIIGFHFYNPPAVQKLVEIIIPPNTNKQLREVSDELIKILHKSPIYSMDVAGFIGNGHFIREIVYAFELVHELSRIHPLHISLYLVNRITKDFLLRPMGIFQLIDYVGLEVVRNICNIMSTYLPYELFQEALIDRLLGDNIFGGQDSNHQQKDGFFQYKNLLPSTIFSFDEWTYVPLQESWNQLLGALPKDHLPYAQLHKDPKRQEKLIRYFASLATHSTLGGEMARKFLLKSREIAVYLVDQKIAKNLQDVDTILVQGFAHLYGPSAEWIGLEVGVRR